MIPVLNIDESSSEEVTSNGLDVNKNVIPLDQSNLDQSDRDQLSVEHGYVEELNSRVQCEEKWTPVKNQQKNSSRKTILGVKAGDKIRYKKSEESELETGTIVSRAGKVTGKDKNQFNIRNEREETYQEHNCFSCSLQEKQLDPSDLRLDEAVDS